MFGLGYNEAERGVGVGSRHGFGRGLADAGWWCLPSAQVSRCGARSWNSTVTQSIARTNLCCSYCP